MKHTDKFEHQISGLSFCIKIKIQSRYHLRYQK